ncbi:uncharacterized protein LOC110274392 [Arachis duranensis]|uniref:Uncharacterized protein LOC110274392 n=1 Tax=Arachis duranensis TaxID=130453 RepID=A0A9C6TDL0_ARADU|nr:uncharacterized protein LOC110274392 [Arachis duranensis]
MVDGETSHLALGATIVNTGLFYTDNHSPRNMARIEILDGVVKLAAFETNCKVVKVPTHDQDLIDRMCHRFGLSSERAYEGILPTITYFKDANWAYFCYKNYDTDFHTLRDNGLTDLVALKRACRRFVSGLEKLHRSNQSHGDVTCYHLVTSNGDGFLGGSIGPSLLDTYTRGHGGASVLVTDPFKKDMVDLAKAIEDSIHPNILPLGYPNTELGMFIYFLKHHNRLNSITPHPYVLTSMEVRDFYVTVREDFRPIARGTLNNEFRSRKSARSFPNSRLGWHPVVRDSADQTLGAFGYANYHNDDMGLVTFIRDFWVHAQKDGQVSVLEHCDDIHRLLEETFPGYSGIVYEVALLGRHGRIIF